MRADRLLSILLLLQSRGRLSTRHLSERLEVSKRTLERDMEALSIAGVPVYAIRGRHGGWELSESYRTDLTGLTEAELRSIVVAVAPTVLAGLGLGEAADQAVVKLLATLPETRRQAAERARRYIHVDPAGWRRHEDAAPFVPVLEEALRLGRRVALDYERMDGSLVERTVDPLGLVAKGSTWYLVAQSSDSLRTYRVARVHAARVLDEPATVPDQFDLATAWTSSRTEFESRLPAYDATVRAAPEALSWLNGGWLRYTRLVDSEPPDAEGWQRCRIRADSPELLRALVLGLGTDVEVIEPVELRDAVLANARSIVAAFVGHGEANGSTAITRRVERGGRPRSRRSTTR